MRSTQIGTIIGILFGCGWAIAAASAFSGKWRIVVIVASLAISAVLVARSFSFAGATNGTFQGGIYGIAVSLEVVAIVAASIFLNRSGNQSFIPPVVAIIVGLHFIGLWRAMNNAVFLFVAVAMCAVGLVAAALPPFQRLPVTGLGSAFALWGAAIYTLFK
jgi:hypothetical protein